MIFHGLQEPAAANCVFCSEENCIRLLSMWILVFPKTEIAYSRAYVQLISMIFCTLRSKKNFNLGEGYPVTVYLCVELCFLVS